MTDYLGGQTREELEALLRRLIAGGAEGPKVDFKQAVKLDENAAQAELAKDVSSIANTDDEVHLDDHGYIILGAEGGKLAGCSDLGGDPDKLQARVTDILKKYVGPVPQFSLCLFEDPCVGRWGAVVIPPSTQQPHIMIRDGAGQVAKHEWWVRVNDTKDRAGPHDYSRILAKGIRRQVQPLERELQRVSLLIESRSGSADLASLLAAIRGEEVPTVVRTPATLAEAVRNRLLRGTNQLEDQLVAEALRLSEVMAETSERNPWVFNGLTPEQVRAVLTYLEERTFPLAEALATVARHDRDGVLTDAVCRALQVLAKEPKPSGMRHQYSAQFRLYPLVICLYGLVTIAVNEQRPDLLAKVLALSVEQEDRDGIYPIVLAVLRVHEAADVFTRALQQDFFEPVAVRVRDTLVPRLSTLLPGVSSREAFYRAEFVIALAYMKDSKGRTFGGVPLAGCYAYEAEGKRTIQLFLERRPQWLDLALGAPLASLLPQFDNAAANLIQRGIWRGNGFTSGAMAAYRPKA